MGNKPGHKSSARLRELGLEMRSHRRRAELTETELGQLAGWSPSKVSRMETGARAVNEMDATIYLANCGVKRDRLEQLLELVRNADDGYWLQAHQLLSGDLRSLIVQENCASAIASFETAVVPGLLQTEDYARALFHWTKWVPAERIELQVRTRIERQNLLTRYSPPQCTFYVYEHALRSVVGGPAVMQEQMLRLLFADTRPQSQVRIVPQSAGPCGSLSGAFMLLDYDEYPSMAYVPLHAVSLLLEKTEVIASYRALVDILAEIALDGGQSRELLARLASEYDRAEGAPDDRPGPRPGLAEEQP
jgi:hypothetical protein